MHRGKKRKRQRKRERQRGKKKLITRTSESVSENKRVFLIRHLDKYKAFVTRVSESFYSFLLFFQPSILSLPLFFFLFRFNYAALVGRDCRKRERERNECRNSQGTLFHHRTFRAFLFYFQNFSLCFFEERDGSIRNF